MSAATPHHALSPLQQHDKIRAPEPPLKLAMVFQSTLPPGPRYAVPRQSMDAVRVLTLEAPRPPPAPTPCLWDVEHDRMQTVSEATRRRIAASSRRQ